MFEEAGHRLGWTVSGRQSSYDRSADPALQRARRQVLAVALAEFTAEVLKRIYPTLIATRELPEDFWLAF
jgi:hypothetical protein